MTSAGAKRDRNARIRRRMLVVFGPTPPYRETGFTTNVSIRGLGVTSNVAHPPGTRLTFQLQLPDGTGTTVSGVVAWASRGSRSLNLPSSMGIRLLETDAAFREYVDGPGVAEPVLRPVAPIVPPVLVPGVVAPAGAVAQFRSLGNAPVLTPIVPPPPVMTAPAPVDSKLSDVVLEQLVASKPEHMPNAVARLPRFEKVLPTWFGVGDSYAYQAETNDVSAGGFAITARAAAMRGAKLKFRIETPRQHDAFVRAEVAWSVRGGGDQPSRLGLRILDGDRAYELMLQDLATANGTPRK